MLYLASGVLLAAFSIHLPAITIKKLDNSGFTDAFQWLRQQIIEKPGLADMALKISSGDNCMTRDSEGLQYEENIWNNGLEKWRR